MQKGLHKGNCLPPFVRQRLARSKLLPLVSKVLVGRRLACHELEGLDCATEHPGLIRNARSDLEPMVLLLDVVDVGNDMRLLEAGRKSAHGTMQLDRERAVLLGDAEAPARTRPAASLGVLVIAAEGMPGSGCWQHAEFS